MRCMLRVLEFSLFRDSSVLTLGSDATNAETLLLAPGGTLADDMTRTNVCVFAAQEDLETMQAFAQVSSEIGMI